MKKYILISLLLIGVALSYNTADAQSINISINIGRQPAWGPVGYDYVDYYYMPDINCYFDVNLGLFYYHDRGRWISARYLPYAYRNYDLYGMYKVVLVNVRNPWRYNNVHYRDYGRYRGHGGQIVIRDSRDMRYKDNRDNRTAWYSGRKNNNYHRKESEYGGRDNNRSSYSNYKQSGRNNNSNLSNKSSERNSKARANTGSSPSGRNNKKDSGATRSANPSERGNYRLASNSERTNRK